MVLKRGICRGRNAKSNLVCSNRVQQRNLPVTLDVGLQSQQKLSHLKDIHVEDTHKYFSVGQDQLRLGLGGGTSGKSVSEGWMFES